MFYIQLFYSTPLEHQDYMTFDCFDGEGEIVWGEIKSVELLRTTSEEFKAAGRICEK